MKNVATTIALLLAGAAAGSALPLPWQAPQAYEANGETVVFTVTVPEANIQAHFACTRLTYKQEN